jgi:arginyl-tRNA synthetase
MFHEFRREVEELAGNYAKYVEIPRDPVADLAIPCFALSKQQQKDPKEIALLVSTELSSSVKNFRLIKEVRALGPYVNFYINWDEFAMLLLKNASRPSYGSGAEKNDHILIESPGPNTNKPLHLGHMRNMVLGTALSNILEFSGYKTTKVDIVNDRGVHICKSMLAYQKFGNSREPDKKSDHFVGDYYVLFAKNLEPQPETENELRQMLVDWENGDQNVIALWRKMRKWCLSGMKETYDRLGTRIDKAYYESEYYQDAKNIVMENFRNGIFERDDDNNIVVNLENKGLGKRVLLRGDGTSVYITQDIALAAKRFKDFKMNKMIYVVASEQIEHFRALFEILKMLGYEFAENCYHLAYGMVNLPDGKMKSREGTVVDADNLMDEMNELASIELKKRDPEIGQGTLEERSEKIGLGAIKFFILKFDAMKTITYDPKSSLSFEGDTGPYVMYTYARCKSILEKSQQHPEYGFLGTEEHKVMKKLSLFPDVVKNACVGYNPQPIAMYALELCALFNEYYHSVKIIGSDLESERLAFVKCVSNVLKKCLELLGIDPLEKM